MRIRRVYESHEVRYFDPGLQTMIYSFAKINIESSSLPTQKELNLRTKNVAYGQYKKEKRLYAKHQAKKKLQWIMSVVKARYFIIKVIAAHE